VISRETAVIGVLTVAVVVAYTVGGPAVVASLGIGDLAGQGSPRVAAQQATTNASASPAYARSFERLDPSVWNDSVTYHNEHASLGFSEVSTAVGLTYRSVQTYQSTQESISNSGVYVADYDADGWTDVLALGGDQPALYDNRGGAFRQTNQLPTIDGIVQSALWVDYDTDGWRDLVLFVVGEKPVVLHNDGGQLTPTDVSLGGPYPVPQAATAGDFDGDGCPGIFLAQYGHWGVEHPYGQHNYSVAHDADNGNANVLYTGDCTGLSNATAGSGIQGTAWSLATSAVDLTADGATDLHVTNDFNHDVVYVNRGDATFDRRVLGNRTNRNGMASEVADVNRDGHPDLFVTNIYFPPRVRDDIEVSLDLRAVGNNLLLNRGDGTFDERAAEYGVQQGGWGWAAIVTDFDNDGDRDLLHSTRMIASSKLTEFFLEDDHRIDRFLRYPVVRERTEDGFARLNASRLGFLVDNGRGVGELDYDRDGDMDVLIADANGPLYLYENTYSGPGQSLQVRLASDRNATALGARVTVTAGGQSQTQVDNARADFLSQDTRVHHFGVGTADRADVTVRWPDGRVTRVDDVATDRRLVIARSGVQNATALN
jgi:hypothetical protein